MYNLPKYNNNHRSNCYSLAQELEPKRYSHSLSTNINYKTSNSSSYQQKQFTFSKNFNQSQHLNSEHVQRRYQPKYRSSSLPSECIVKNLRSNHFSYYDQLKRRDYITANNCQYLSNNQYQPLFNKEKFISYSSANNLNRFYKYDLNTKIVKNFNRPIVATNVKIFDKYDQNNRFTQIQSNFQPQNNVLTSANNSKNQRPNQVPLFDCNIEVKSDDQGRFYSTVESQFPAVLTHQNTVYDQKQHVFTTHATLVRDYSHSFDNLPLRVQQKDLLVPKRKNDLKTVVKEKFNQDKQRQTILVKKKKTQTNELKTEKQNENEQQKYLKNVESRKQKPKQSELNGVQGSIKEKIVLEYLPDKQIKSPRSNIKNQHSIKKTTQNDSQKYTYSKYFIAEMESKKQKQEHQKAIAFKPKRQREMVFIKTRSKCQNFQEINEIFSPKSKTNKERLKEFSQQSYVSTHQFTIKK